MLFQSPFFHYHMESRCSTSFNVNIWLLDGNRLEQHYGIVLCLHFVYRIQTIWNEQWIRQKYRTNARQKDKRTFGCRILPFGWEFWCKRVPTIFEWLSSNWNCSFVTLAKLVDVVLCDKETDYVFYLYTLYTCIDVKKNQEQKQLILRMQW